MHVGVVHNEDDGQMAPKMVVFSVIHDNLDAVIAAGCGAKAAVGQFIILPAPEGYSFKDGIAVDLSFSGDILSGTPLTISLRESDNQDSPEAVELRTNWTNRGAATKLFSYKA